MAHGRHHRGGRAASGDAALAVGAGFLGWTLDAFDFFLVVMALPQIAAEFKVSHTAATWALTLTLMFRPVGALIFGLLADRYGRRIPMMANLVFFSIVEVATGFAPTFTAFLVLRALFGVGMGGEWGVGASLVMEKVSPRWRGVLSGLLQEGYAAGYFLAALASYFLLDRRGLLLEFDPHHWRVMMFLGGVPAVLAVFIRFFVRESEVWEKSKAESWTQLGAGLASNWKLWLYLTLLMAMMNFSSHGTQDMFPTFMKTFRGMDPKVYSKVVMVAMTGAILGGLVFGLASDHRGRRRMMVAAFVGALLVSPVWAFSERPGWIFAGAFLMQFMVQGAWGIIPAHISELSPDRVRGFLPGFAYQCGNLIAASIATIQSRSAESFPYPRVMFFSACGIFTVAIVVTLLGPERRGHLFGHTPGGPVPE